MIKGLIFYKIKPFLLFENKLVEYLFTAADDDAFLEGFCIDLRVEGFNLSVVQNNAALHNKTLCFALGGSKLTHNHDIKDTDLAIDKRGFFDFSSRHISAGAAACEEVAGNFLCLVSFFLAMNERGELVCSTVLELTRNSL